MINYVLSYFVSRRSRNSCLPDTDMGSQFGRYTHIPEAPFNPTKVVITVIFNQISNVLLYATAFGMTVSGRSSFLPSFPAPKSGSNARGRPLKSCTPIIILNLGSNDLMLLS